MAPSPAWAAWLGQLVQQPQWIIVMPGLALICYFFYLITIDPLGNYPGPLLNQFTCLPWVIHHLRGTQWSYAHELHKKYGPIVRVAPNELSIITMKSWNTIFSRRSTHSTGQDRFPKPDWLFGRNKTQRQSSIFGAKFKEHAELRAALALAFSPPYKLESVEAIQRCVARMTSQLRDQLADGQEVVDIADLFSRCVTDIMSVLTLGESFGCLAGDQTHGLLGRIARMHMILAGLRRLVPNILVDFVQFFISKSRDEFISLCKRTLAALRDDLTQPAAEERNKMTEREARTAAELILEGVNTTASVLTTALCLLATHPEVMSEICWEIRNEYPFESILDIDMISVKRLQCLGDVVNETMRMFPPMPAGLPRVVPPEASLYIGRHLIVENTIVSIPGYALSRCGSSWRSPNQFRPDRWRLYEGENEYFRLPEWTHPFLGLTGCLGKSLARSLILLILAQLLFEFDIELDPTSQGWLDGRKSWGAWEPKPLFVRLRAVDRARNMNRQAGHMTVADCLGRLQEQAGTVKRRAGQQRQAEL